MKGFMEVLKMKQTKKPTRNQRELLQRKFNIDTEGVRIVEETKDYITVQHKNNNVETFWKQEV